MKKGFTLVEVLAIIAVLGIILITVVPNIGGSIEKKKEEEYKKIINLIENAGKTYYSYNNDIISVGVDELLKEDLITTDLINPITNEKISGCVNVTTDEDGIKQFIFSDKCNVLLSTHLENLYNTNASENGLVKDDTDDENIRYAGSDGVVKNYVSFNDEIWRIIGLFNVSDGNKIEKRVKIVRNSSIGSYSFDSSTSDMNEGHGYNIWETVDGETKADGTTKADLNILLTEGYYGGTYPSLCYGGVNNTTKACPIRKLNNESKNMIENAIWNLGRVESEAIQPKEIYDKERKTESNSLYKTSWIGPVGLIYASDYAYAVDRNVCTLNINKYSNTNCSTNNWLNKNTWIWTLTAKANTHEVFYISNNGDVYVYFPNAVDVILPSVYLKSNILLESGSGTSDDPYILKLL